MSDKLQEIKARAADPKMPWQRADFVWLMDEVERLRAERYVDSEVVVLRGEVDVLVTAAIAKDAEIERLRVENVELVGAALVNGEQLAEMSALVKAQAENVALRGALQALVDATESTSDPLRASHVLVDGSEFRAARGRAVRLLLPGTATGLTGENLGDSGMRQAGGVSDGPQ